LGFDAFSEDLDAVRHVRFLKNVIGADGLVNGGVWLPFIFRHPAPNVPW